MFGKKAQPPIKSLIEHALARPTTSEFTLVYGNRRMGSVMFNEALQDLKDRYADQIGRASCRERVSSPV